MFVAFVTVGGSPGAIFTTSHTCLALFAECEPHACGSFTSRSPLPALLSRWNPQFIKTFILFLVLLSHCHTAPLAISVTDILVCLHPCVWSHAFVCMNVREPRAKFCHWSMVLYPLLWTPVLLLQRSYTPLSHGLWCAPIGACAGQGHRGAPGKPALVEFVFVGPDFSGWMWLMLYVHAFPTAAPAVVFHVCVWTISSSSKSDSQSDPVRFCPWTSSYRC